MPGQFQFDPHFREAFENVPHTVFGRRLKPFCLWHRFCLEMLNSPVLTGDPVDKVHLLGAVTVCQSQFDGTGYVPTFPNASGVLRGVWMRLKLARYNIAAEVKKFGDYLEDFHSNPKLWDEGASQTTFAEIDPLLNLVIHMIANGVPPTDAWNMPIGMVNWYSVGLMKLQGCEGIDIWTPHHELALQEQIKKRDATIAARTAEIVAGEGIPEAEAKTRATGEYWEAIKKRNEAMKAGEKIYAKYGARLAPGMAVHINPPGGTT